MGQWNINATNDLMSPWGGVDSTLDKHTARPIEMFE